MTYEKIKKIYDNNQVVKENTYLVPDISFENFIRDELMFVRVADGYSCKVFRSMDGKIYSLTKDQIKKFKCVGSCSC